MKKIAIIALTLLTAFLAACSNSTNNNDNKINSVDEHVCSYVTQVVECTCSTEGYTYHSCRGCGYSYKDNIIKALGHDYIEREQNYKCSRCGRYEDEGFIFEMVDGTYYIKSVSGKAVENGKVTTPKKHMGLSVTGIKSGAFYNIKSSMNEIIISENIKYIGSLLFCYNGGYRKPDETVVLNTIKFDSNCFNINISHTAFQFCQNVTNISMPDDCISMINHDDYISNHFLFEDTKYYKNHRTEENGCYYLFDILLETDSDKIGSTVLIKSGTKIIANQAFKGNTNIKTIELPSSLKYIGKQAFAQCMNLSVIIYPETKQQFDEIIIESNSFQDCKTITYQFN